MGEARRLRGARCRAHDRLVVVVLSFVLAALHGPPAQVPPEVCSFRVDPDSASALCPAAGGLYYAMLHGDAISVITSAVCVTLQDTNGLASLRHRPAGGLDGFCGFYAVLGVPLAAPDDLDRDGMDDVFELSHGFLNPLNAVDALADEDGDGVSNLVEYRQGRNLTAGSVPGTPANVGLVVHAPPAW